MHREKGFSLIEVMIATAVMLIIMGTTLSMLTDAMHANEAVVAMADMQDNLRASMNLMVRDLVQAGGGIPIGGISVPYTDPLNNPLGAPVPAAMNRPSPPTKAYTFPLASAITSVNPGFTLGPNSLGQLTDMITVIYADNELPWTTAMAPINNPAGPKCNGVIAANGSTITFDTVTAGCAILAAGNVSVVPGDLIMLSNNQGGNIVQLVSAVAGSKLTFNPGDAFGFNGNPAASGTIAQMQTAPGVFPPTSATRIWMVTYYIDATTVPGRPQLIRQVNFNAPQVVGQVIEGMQISYDVVNAVATAPPNNARNIIAPDSPNQIRKINLYLMARSENPYSVTKQYFRANLLTQVGMRGLSFQNRYN
ncbi:MAG TPA: prepilin-type N-terminal cleavage/methylation domain-containing protein [Candidatus Limnocylindria bacterium]|nr:prepilin-type N-terminal cleavage/methylation domain-containing protein [Candidatus Limnocylindria bacterium]